MIEHMFDVDELPPGLDRTPPSALLGILVSGIDPTRLTAADRVPLIQALSRQISHLQALVCAAIDSLADHMDTVEFPDDPDLAWEAATTELRAALRLTRRAAEDHIDFALTVRRRLPRLWHALARGHIDPPRVRVLVEGTSHLDEPTARRVITDIIADAPRLTTGQLAARCRHLCLSIDPDAAHRRHHHTVEQRRVVLEATPNGTAHLHALDLAPERALAAAERIDRIAMSLNRTGDTRSIDQLRADVTLDLLAGRHTDIDGGIVNIHVDLATLTRLADTPGDLDGYGPVIADIARQVATAHTNAQWRYTITDPTTGLPLDNGTTRRRPTTTQRRRVETRDPHCVFPGCRTPATRCDLDHTTPWAQLRRTTSRGLCPLCRHDHITVRHHLGWTYRPLPGGDYLWTSPLGHTYTTSGLPP